MRFWRQKPHRRSATITAEDLVPVRDLALALREVEAIVLHRHREGRATNPSRKSTPNSVCRSLGTQGKKEGVLGRTIFSRVLMAISS